MLACEPPFAPIAGWRIIADPTALDNAVWPPRATAVRISPDDAFVIGRTMPTVADPHAIITPEHGFVGATLNRADVAHIAERHIEWVVPTARPALAQGQIAGVPAKLMLNDDGTTLLLVAAAAHHELAARLGSRMRAG